jgi:BlaI family transcriptional regulator, penicillinase repressor
MSRAVEPTQRELAILKVLWDRGEASVREVHESLREEIPIVQNTVQAFLRTMEAKGLVAHRTEGRTFVYRPTRAKEQTSRRLLSGLLERVYDGAIDQLVESALSLRAPTPEELAKLRALVDRADAAGAPDRARAPDASNAAGAPDGADVADESNSAGAHDGTDALDGPDAPAGRRGGRVR